MIRSIFLALAVSLVSQAAAAATYGLIDIKRYAFYKDEGEWKAEEESYSVNITDLDRSYYELDSHLGSASGRGLFFNIFYSVGVKLQPFVQVDNPFQLFGAAFYDVGFCNVAPPREAAYCDNFHGAYEVVNDEFSNELEEQYSFFHRLNYAFTQNVSYQDYFTVGNLDLSLLGSPVAEDFIELSVAHPEIDDFAPQVPVPGALGLMLLSLFPLGAALARRRLAGAVRMMRHVMVLP